MADKVEVKVLELEADKLKAGSKYIFFVEELALDDSLAEELVLELSRLLGQDNFTVIRIDGINNIKVYSVEE